MNALSTGSSEYPVRQGSQPPWAWWNDRCYRTVKAMHRDVPIERLGTHHNALSDATSQALHLIKMLAPRPPTEMIEIGTAMDYHAGMSDGPMSQRAAELVGAGLIVAEWADEIKKEAATRDAAAPKMEGR